jgi:HlyD family type I secretion membrane fusion protein
MMSDVDAEQVIKSDSPRIPVLVGMLAAVAFFVAMFGWASAMSVSGGAIASGKVAVEGNRKAIQHRDGGPVARVLVREGERVKKGQALLDLDLTDVRAEFGVLTNSRLVSLARISRLRSEARDAPEITWSDELTSSTDDAQRRSSIEQEQSLFVARRAAYQGNIALLQKEIEGRQRQIEGLRARLVTTRAQLTSVQAEFTSLQPLAAQGIVSRPRILALERTGSGLQGDIETGQNSIASEENGILQAQTKIAQLEKDRRESIAKDMNEAESRLAEVEPRLKSAQEKLARGTMISPDDGYVYNLAVFSPGAVLTPGQVVMEIVPTDDALVIAVEISPTDIERVRPGLRVNVHLLSYTQRWQSIIQGELVKISADRFDDPYNKQTSFYKGIVRVDAADLKRAGAELAPGMPAQVIIQTEDRTILSYFMNPIFRMYDFALRER